MVPLGEEKEKTHRQQTRLLVLILFALDHHCRRTT
jgi:hypothetical protein